MFLPTGHIHKVTVEAGGNKAHSFIV